MHEFVKEKGKHQRRKKKSKKRSKCDKWKTTRGEPSTEKRKKRGGGGEEGRKTNNQRSVEVMESCNGDLLSLTGKGKGDTQGGPTEVERGSDSFS